MSVIGNISGVPLFTTIQEALAWAQARGLSGYHRHTLAGVQGYMGGVNHQQASNPQTTVMPPVVAVIAQPVINTTLQVAQLSVNEFPVAQGGGGGGGGGGY